MPKLPAKVQKNVEAAEQVTGGFEPLRPGTYAARLLEVGVEEHQNYPDHVSVWVCQFNDLHDASGKKHPGRQFLRINVILDENVPATYPKDESKWATFVRMANGQMKAFFENLGYTTDSDTDEMLGAVGALKIGIRTIQTGARSGEKVNEVNGVVPVPSTMEDLIESVVEGANSGAADEDSF